MLYKKYLPVTLLFILSLISIVNLFHPGFPITHDGDVHLLRLTNFYQSLQEGNVVPRWAANVNFGYGQPVFEFFYPFPSYLASLFHITGFSFADSLKIILILGMLLSGITMYLWLSQLVSKQAAMIGGLLYVFAPFRFVDTYVRGDVGESFAFIFTPLVLYFIYKIPKKPSIVYVFLGAISFVLLILTHNIVSLMLLPFILFYAIFSWWGHNKKKLYASYIIWLFILGFGLSAFFWMPGLFEGKYTLRNIVTAGSYKDRFVEFSQLIYGPWSYGGTGFFTVQLGVLQWVILIVSILYILFKSLKGLSFRATNGSRGIFGRTILILGLIIYTLIAIFLMLQYSNFIWSKVMLLQNFQFPWRFLIVTVFTTSVLGALMFDGITPARQVPACNDCMSGRPGMAGGPPFSSFRARNDVLIVIVIIVILLLNKDYWHAKGFVQRPDNFFAGVQQAPADTGETSPIWSIRFMEHGYKNPLEVIEGNAIIQKGKRTTTEHKYTLTVQNRSRFLENTLYFPGWEVLANGKKVPLEFQDQRYRGLMTFNLDPGKYTIDVKFVETKFRLAADVISLISAIIVIFYSAGSVFIRRKV